MKYSRAEYNLPYPVTFVLKYPERWPELFSESSTLDPASLHARIKTNEDCWIVTTYLYLKSKELDVLISDKFTPGQINVVSSLDYSAKDLAFNSFVVGTRSDGFKPSLCDFVIVQNRFQLDSETDAFIPHWPQPGLIPRSQKRGNMIENLTFKGNARNLYEPFHSSEFKRELEKLGLDFRINVGSAQGTVSWHDYSTDDLVLAVRDLTESDVLVKPASKLVNAWIAGVPALLGPEPAFQDFKQSTFDYIEIKSTQEALEAIQKLKSNPDLYRRMVANGLKRAEEFTVENMIRKWVEVLSGPIANQYRQWRKKTKLERMTNFLLRFPQHKFSMREATYHRSHGKYIISGRYV
ncbi:glycosyltransferase [Nodosilinea sp. LEGE 06152]|uniref:glycosyltransferase n=1 Tax=Nodosilinea sp. LEGE 06152 TaxID=2777966 RepID=UPI0018807041|nr:glycosyltransferase [Nodosilinea sp. LEGE 06152]MBE9157555.1 glycosyltransferase [Nodosilinea sp. LEGE 06152]